MRKFLRRYFGLGFDRDIEQLTETMRQLADELEEATCRNDTALQKFDDRITRKINDLDHLTREDWDIGARGPSTVVLTGVYRGRGYVKFYEVPAEEFNYLVEMFRSRGRDHLIRNVDAPYSMDGAFTL